MVRYRNAGGRFITNRSGRRGNWQRMASALTRGRGGSLLEGRTARRAAGAAGMIGAAGSIARGAVTGGWMGAGKAAAMHVGRWGAKRLFKHFTRNRTKRSTSSATKWHTTGGYQGSFKRPTRGAGRSMDIYNKKGWTAVSEYTGSVSDPDCCYLLNAAVSANDVLFYSMAAAVRKLFELAGISPTGLNEGMFTPSGGSFNSTQLQVGLISINLQTGLETASVFYAITTTSLFADVVGAFMPYIQNYSAGSGSSADANMELPYKLVLTEQVPTTVPYQVVNAEVLFSECSITLSGKSIMKVQNRTKATGGSEDETNINNNPLQGRIYQLSGLPKPKANGKRIGGLNSAVFPFERLQYPDEVSSFGSASGGFDPEFREPPSPGYFYNCSKSSFVRLEPGAIKSYTLGYSKHMNILRLWRMVRLQRNTGNTFVQFSTFPVQMLALEDVINANAAENISIQFEVERHFGAYASIKHNRFTKTHLVVKVL